MALKLFCLFLVLLSSTVSAHFYTPERLAFPALCDKHYNDPRKYTTNTWIEPVDVKEFAPYLKYLPRPYEADCYGCSGCGGMRLSRREEFRLPFENPKFAYDQLTKLHQQVRYGTLETCRHRGSERCEPFCWDGGYFRRLNRKYLPFFKEFLVYCEQNSLCKCFWHERYEKAVAINNLVYRFVHSLIEQKLIRSDFSSDWVSLEIGFNRKGRKYGKEYFPNSHGMASSLTTYTFFYSHYDQMLKEVMASIDVHADPLQSIVAKDQVYQLLEELHEKFMPLYTRCLSLHPHPKIYLERSLLYMQKGNFEEALQDLLVNPSEALLLGDVYASLKQYDKAIEAYNLAKNDEVFFPRAMAYFNLGMYQAAYEDYVLSKKGELTASQKTSDEFKEALLRGLIAGAKGSSVAQRPFWALLERATINDLFANGCEEVGRAFSTGSEGFPEDVAQFFASYHLLGDSEKGERLGAAIGKYGILLFSNGKSIKQIKLFKQLQEANFICNFAAYSDKLIAIMSKKR